MKRLLVLNTELSGINKYLFKELEKYGWKMTFVEVPFPLVVKLMVIIISFKFSFQKWKECFYGRLWKYYKSPFCFKLRSRKCEKILERFDGKFDAIFPANSPK